VALKDGFNPPESSEADPTSDKSIKKREKRGVIKGSYYV
jgi:hypothetical protein